MLSLHGAPGPIPGWGTKVPQAAVWRTEEIPAPRGGHTAAGLGDPPPGPLSCPVFRAHQEGSALITRTCRRVRGHVLEWGARQARGAAGGGHARRVSWAGASPSPSGSRAPPAGGTGSSAPLCTQQAQTR